MPLHSFQRYLAITLVVTVASSAADVPGSASVPILPEGTPVRIKINRTVSSADVEAGQNVDFTTLDDIKVRDMVVIPQGSIAMATITEAKAKGHLGKAASSA